MPERGIDAVEIVIICSGRICKLDHFEKPAMFPAGGAEIQEVTFGDVVPSNINVQFIFRPELDAPLCHVCEVQVWPLSACWTHLEHCTHFPMTPNPTC